jgi:hypothetical protein
MDEANQRIQWLYRSINERKRPEDVADYILRLLGNQLSGVSVANPMLASALRRAGFFSGKPTQPGQDLPMGSEIHSEALQAHHQRLQDQHDPLK